VDLSLAVLLLHQLERFDEEGFDVTGVSAPGPYVSNLEAAGIAHAPVESLSRRWDPIRDQKAVRELVALFREQRPDIVHTHNPKSGVLGRAAARLARVPVVVNTVHGLYSNPAIPPVKRTIIGGAEWGAARLSNHEFFQSAEDYDYALRTHMVRPSRASVLGNGVDLTRFDPSNVTKKAIVEQRKAWRATPSKVVIGTVGRLVFEKGFAEFFAAIREVRRTHKNVVPVVVGPQEPSKDDALSAADIARAKAEGIVFHGSGETGEMPAIYGAFDIFVLASHREGMPRSAIEASAMARPVIATNIRGCREVVADGETGLLVPVRSPRALAVAIDRLVVDAPLRQLLGDAGRQRATLRFDEELVVERTLAVYRRLLAERGPRT
jgi:glycosyltransferase involved in cell wall biosynthesis